MFLRQAIDTFLDGYFSTCERSPKTVAAYTSDLEQFRAGQPARRRLTAITPEDLERWAMELKARGFAPASLRRKTAVLKIFFNYWVRKRVLDRSPLWQLRFDFGRSRPLTRTLTPSEVKALLRQARSDLGRIPRQPSGEIDAKFLALRDLALLELLFATGLRVGEAAALRLGDLRLEERALLVRGKGDRQRLAFLPEAEVFDALATYARHREAIAADTESIFLNSAGAGLTPQGMAGVLHKKAQAAGIARHLTPHMLRHTAATFLLQNGADLRIVQEFLGHTSITTTQRYTHVAKFHLKETLGRCHPKAMLRGVGRGGSRGPSLLDSQRSEA